MAERKDIAALCGVSLDKVNKDIQRGHLVADDLGSVVLYCMRGLLGRGLSSVEEEVIRVNDMSISELEEAGKVENLWHWDPDLGYEDVV